MERLCAACSQPCVCGGHWPYWANKALQLNRIDCGLFWHTLYMALHDGRREDKTVMVSVGKRGGEGKSFLFSPLKAVYGLEHVMLTPEKGSFPLVGLECKRVVLLDEWRFNASVLSLTTQLLWLEGKPLVLPQPQNTGVVGHKLYRGTAPLFVTTKEQYLDALEREAAAALAVDGASEATMLLRRLRLFKFGQKLPIPEGTHIPDCAHCFARMVLTHASQYHAKTSS